MIEQWLIDHETAVIGFAFYSTLALVAVWESLQPAKPPTTSTALRWLNNIVLIALCTLVIRWIFPLLAVALSFTVANNGWGLLNLVSWPLWLVLPASVLILDLAAYWVHRLLHQVPLLWRLHKIHHSDLDFDVTTALRFHPLEPLVTVTSSLLIIAALGASPVAVIVSEALATGLAFINHGNIHLPQRLDHFLRACVVTPDMHRIHHSVVVRENNSNFAVIFSVWDRLFGSYCRDPAAGQDGMVIGLAGYRDARSLNLPQLLMMPFARLSPADGAVQATAHLESDPRQP